MRAVAVALLLLVLGCEPVVPEGRCACATDEDCPDEMVCRPERGRCYATLADGGGERDAGPRDAGEAAVDAGDGADGAP